MNEDWDGSIWKSSYSVFSEKLSCLSFRHEKRVLQKWSMRLGMIISGKNNVKAKVLKMLKVGTSDLLMKKQEAYFDKTSFINMLRGLHHDPSWGKPCIQVKQRWSWDLSHNLGRFEGGCSYKNAIWRYILHSLFIENIVDFMLNEILLCHVSPYIPFMLWDCLYHIIASGILSSFVKKRNDWLRPIIVVVCNIIDLNAMPSFTASNAANFMFYC